MILDWKSPPFPQETWKRWGTLKYGVLPRNIEDGQALPGGNLGVDGLVAFEGVADVIGGNGAEAADAPEIATKFDDGGGHHAASLASIEDEWETIAELAEDFFPAGAGGRARNVGAGAGEGNADFRDEIRDDFGFRPAERDAAGVGGDFEGKAVGGVDDDGERAGPASFGETIEIIGELLSEHQSVLEIVDENGKGAMLGASFDAEDFFDGSKIDGIGGEGIERVGGDGDDRSTIEPGSSVAHDARIGIGCADFEDLSRQTVPFLFWSEGGEYSDVVEIITGSNAGAMMEEIGLRVEMCKGERVKEGVAEAMA